MVISAIAYKGNTMFIWGKDGETTALLNFEHISSFKEKSKWGQGS